MTVVAWDGRTLAADKRGTNAGLAYTVTKIHRLPDGLVAFSGGGAHAAELLNWFYGARNPATYPRREGDDGAGSLMINQDGVIFMYAGANPFPERIEGAFFARGSGRDYAMAAMHLGCDAKRAVEVACALDVFCGNGIDVLELRPTENQSQQTASAPPEARQSASLEALKKYSGSLRPTYLEVCQKDSSTALTPPHFPSADGSPDPHPESMRPAVPTESTQHEVSLPAWGGCPPVPLEVVRGLVQALQFVLRNP